MEPTWHVLLVTSSSPVEYLVYIVQAASREIAFDKCIRAALAENQNRSFAEMAATPVDISIPHQIMKV